MNKLRLQAKEILEDNMSEVTDAKLAEIEYLKEWVINAMLEFVELNKPQWISVKDGLPELISQHGDAYGSGYLLAFDKFGEMCIAQYWSNGFWEYDREIVYEEYDPEYITYWMDVPPTPKQKNCIKIL